MQSPLQRSSHKLIPCFTSLWWPTTCSLASDLLYAIPSHVRLRGALATALETESHPINGKDNYGWTPLDRASALGRVECIQSLLDKGADATLANHNGEHIKMTSIL